MRFAVKKRTFFGEEQDISEGWFDFGNLVICACHRRAAIDFWEKLQ